MCDISAFLNDSATIMNSETSDVDAYVHQPKAHHFKISDVRLIFLTRSVHGISG